jgi:hypothetical protein
MVGARDGQATDVDLALSALRDVGAALDPALTRVRTGRDLVALARRRGALDAASQPLLGDLVVFDAVVAREPASQVGVVVSTDSNGTIEFVYLARGVVRRGWVNPIHREHSRDDAGRVLNTFLRHSDGRDPRGTRYLSGELFATFIRLDRLLDPGRPA